MKQIKAMKLCLIISFLFLLFGCDKNDEITSFEGDIVGFVKLIDNNGTEITDKSGVKVSIEGSGNTTITGESGRYELGNIATGTYNLIYDKSGYGTHKHFSYQFIGGDIPAFIDVVDFYELPNVELVNVDISFTDDGSVFSNNGLEFVITTTETYNIRFTAFFSGSEDVSKSNYDYKFSYSDNAFSTPLTEISTYFGIDSSPFSKGDTVYIKLYFCNFFEEYMHYDYDSEDYRYSSYKEASDVIEFVIK